MEKYELLPHQLIYEGTVSKENFFSPSTLDEVDILRVHDAEYWQKLKHMRLSKPEIRKTGFPLSQKLVERECIIAQGTIECALYALQFGVSMNVAGGTHHAYPDRGEGFCLLNDIGLAAAYLLAHGLVKRVLVVDLDVHQGNGTALMFSDEERIFTFSMHGEKNYPLKKEISNLDIPLQDLTTDTYYLQTLERALDEVFDDFAPEFVFYQSGVDVLASDKLGRISLSIDGCKERDRLVIDKCFRTGVPLVSCMGGGYSEKISVIVEAHANTFRIAKDLYF